MKELTEDNLKEVLSSSGVAIVQYGATWCGNCRMIKPKIKKLAAEREDIQFYYVDAEKYPASRGLADVSNLPTFALFKEGQLIKQNQGNKIDLVKELVDEIASH